MSTSHGKFVWYDVMTSDTKAAESFYRSVIGWSTEDAGMPDRSYTLLSVGPTMVGGLMPIPPDARAMGVRPCWMGYVAVDDVDAYAARVKAAGGAVHREPEDIPGVGRFAVAADPHGAGFLLFKGTSDQMPAPVPWGTPGHIGWRELYAGDGASDFAFYSSLFGWTKAESFDMGAMGIYQLFATGDGPCGGVMTKPSEIAAPFWLYYINVDDINAAAARVKDNGGEILMGPHEVPGGSWILQCRDPQGAMFALIRCAPAPAGTA
jgi:uncharacterized protein